MLVTWRYRARDTLIQRLDPRARMIFLGCMIFAVFQFWDLRFLLGFLVLALGQTVLARLTWRETRRFWLVITFIGLVLTLMTAITGRGEFGLYRQEHVVWQSPAWRLLGLHLSVTLSAERLTFMLSQLTRLFCFAAFAVVVPYTMHPARYGVTFRRLGLSDKFAFAMDLAFRFIPSLGQDFEITLDAQRARGYELERAAGGLAQQIRHMAPLIIPITVGSIVGAEEVIDAMDLRAFGTGPRTWYEDLQYQPRDYVLIALSGLILLGSVLLGLSGHAGLWVPAWLTAMGQ
jgi:energy-coupling factor transport system permease protein